MAKSILIANRILSSLPHKQLSMLRPHLSAVDLPIRKQLECRNKRIEHVYFIEQGLASVVAYGPPNRTIEVGIIGREGMTGMAVVLGEERSPHETFMQVAGAGQRIRADRLREAMHRNASLHRTLLHYAYAFHIQTTQTSLANGRSKIEERLARWLLVADDRIGGGELKLTHEFLSIMLGVGRAGVTVATQSLEDAGLIANKRGRITILDKPGLIVASAGTYVDAEGCVGVELYDADRV